MELRKPQGRPPVDTENEAEVIEIFKTDPSANVKDVVAATGIKKTKVYELRRTAEKLREIEGAPPSEQEAGPASKTA